MKNQGGERRGGDVASVVVAWGKRPHIWGGEEDATGGGGAIICYRRLFLINGLIALIASRERKVRITAPPHRRQRGRSSGPGKHNQRRSTKKSTKRRQRPSVHLCRQTATAQGVGLDREKKEEIGNEFKDYETKKEIGGHTTLQQGSLTP